jgi:hypothetical protein
MLFADDFIGSIPFYAILVVLLIALIGLFIYMRKSANEE